MDYEYKSRLRSPPKVPPGGGAKTPTRAARRLFDDPSAPDSSPSDPTTNNKSIVYADRLMPMVDRVGASAYFGALLDGTVAQASSAGLNPPFPIIPTTQLPETRNSAAGGFLAPEEGRVIGRLSLESPSLQLRHQPATTLESNNLSLSTIGDTDDAMEESAPDWAQAPVFFATAGASTAVSDASSAVGESSDTHDTSATASTTSPNSSFGSGSSSATVSPLSSPTKRPAPHHRRRTSSSSRSFEYLANPIDTHSQGSSAPSHPSPVLSASNDGARLYQSLLASELRIPPSIGNTNTSPKKFTAGSEFTASTSPPASLFSYAARPIPPASPYRASTLSPESEQLLSAPRKAARVIPTVPYKVLEAPDILDDFYSNVVDWGVANTLAVGLGSDVYLWNAGTAKVDWLCSFDGQDAVTAVAWADATTSAENPGPGAGGLFSIAAETPRAPINNQLIVGTAQGRVVLFDVTTLAIIREWTGHLSRVGAISFNAEHHLIATGSRDRQILLVDPRAPLRGLAHASVNSVAPELDDSASVPMNFPSRLLHHSQEVCGLKWGPTHLASEQLASGGNDNKLFVFDSRNLQSGPIHRYLHHTAAIKALAWSPHQRGLLASGGGSADRCIRFWNTLDSPGKGPLVVLDTGSQVCNLAWSKTVNEIVSTHGYSQNQIIIWSYPTMTPMATLTGHTMRVLFLAMSPDGQNVVTGAGDETLRFWNVFPSSRGARSLWFRRFSGLTSGGLVGPVGGTPPPSSLFTRNIIR